MSASKVKEWSRDGYSDERAGIWMDIEGKGDFYNRFIGLVACRSGVLDLYNIPDQCSAIRVCVRKCSRRPSGAYKVKPSERLGFACVEDPDGNQIVCPNWIHGIWVSVDRVDLWVWVEIDA